MKVQPQFAPELEQLVARWNDAVERGTYKPKAKKSYIDYIAMFLRFAKDEFTSEKIHDPTAGPKPKRKAKRRPSQDGQ